MLKETLLNKCWEYLRPKKAGTTWLKSETLSNTHDYTRTFCKRKLIYSWQTDIIEKFREFSNFIGNMWQEQIFSYLSRLVILSVILLIKSCHSHQQDNRILSLSDPYFLAFGLNVRKYGPENSECGHFSRSERSQTVNYYEEHYCPESHLTCARVSSEQVFLKTYVF